MYKVTVAKPERGQGAPTPLPPPPPGQIAGIQHTKLLG